MERIHPEGVPGLISHRHNFEADGTNWDGGAVQYSVNGGAFQNLSGASFTQNGYTGVIGGTTIAFVNPST